MNAYDLLIESATNGRGRQLSPDNVIWLLQLIQNMDAALAALYDGEAPPDIVDAEVINSEQVPKGEGLDRSDERVDTPQSEEEE